MVVRAVLALSLLLSFSCLGGEPADEPPVEPDAGSAGEGEGDPVFMEPCDLEADRCVEPSFCFDFNSRGAHCTRECTLDDQCEAPSRGCNNMGVCKAP